MKQFVFYFSSTDSIDPKTGESTLRLLGDATENYRDGTALQQQEASFNLLDVGVADATVTAITIEPEITLGPRLVPE